MQASIFDVSFYQFINTSKKFAIIVYMIHCQCQHIKVYTLLQPLALIFPSKPQGYEVTSFANKNQ